MLIILFLTTAFQKENTQGSRKSTIYELIQSRWISKEDKNAEVKIDKSFYYDYYQRAQLSKLKFGLYNKPIDVFSAKIDSNGSYLCVFESTQDYRTAYHYKVIKVSKTEMVLFYIDSEKYLGFYKSARR